MQLLRHISALSFWQNKSAVTIGTFDGIHIGHQTLLQNLKKHAQKHHLKTVVVLFEPQPKEFFVNEKAPRRILRLRDKLAILKSIDIDAVLCLKFNDQLANISREDFIQAILVNGLNTEHLVIGDDFRFGKNRLGDFDYCTQVGKTLGFSVESTPTVLMNQKRISSTRVRHAIEQGNFGYVRQLLNRDYTLIGKVIHGDKRGRLLGFPTANLLLKKPMAVHGVYVVKVSVAGGPRLPRHVTPRNDEMYGVANVGRRPTIGDDKQLLEVFILDFNESIYNRSICVTFLTKLRDEQRFDNLDVLKAQIDQDVSDAKNFIKETM